MRHIYALSHNYYYLQRSSVPVVVFYGNTTVLTLKVIAATIDAQWEGMGDVRSARYEPV